jgi:hypothetical protein
MEDVGGHWIGAAAISHGNKRVCRFRVGVREEFDPGDGVAGIEVAIATVAAVVPDMVAFEVECPGGSADRPLIALCESR